VGKYFIMVLLGLVVHPLLVALFLLAFPKTLLLTNINWWFVIGFAITPNGM
jgi:hypothetical protein